MTIDYKSYSYKKIFTRKIDTAQNYLKIIQINISLSLEFTRIKHIIIWRPPILSEARRPPYDIFQTSEFIEKNKY